MKRVRITTVGKRDSLTHAAPVKSDAWTLCCAAVGKWPFHGPVYRIESTTDPVDCPDCLAAAREEVANG